MIASYYKGEDPGLARQRWGPVPGALRRRWESLPFSHSWAFDPPVNYDEFMMGIPLTLNLELDTSAKVPRPVILRERSD
jgi:hypothetical protein